MENLSPAGSAAFDSLIRLDNWTVSAYRSVDGGGTGQEFVENLLKDWDSPGNKWYDCCSGETWIKGQFNTPIIVKKVTLQSANDCIERDPYTVSFYDDKHNLLCQYDHINFTNRYEKKDFLVDSNEPVESIKIVIERNRSYALTGFWGSGTQLAQVIFYHK